MSTEGTVIDLPNPALVILIGLQGSGKSTFARQHFAPTEILSSDEFRARMCNDPASQSNNGPALEQLMATLRRRLSNKVTTVVDATNVRRDQRSELLDTACQQAVPAVAILLDIPVDRCRERIAERARIIRDEVLDDHAAQWPQVVDDVAREGYSAVHVLTERHVPMVRFRHGSPPDLDPDRWVDVDQLVPAGRSLRFPADEIRRHPDVLATRDPNTFDYACAAAKRALAEALSTAVAAARPPIGSVLRVRLPHCRPIDLTRERDGWRRARMPRRGIRDRVE